MPAPKYHISLVGLAILTAVLLALLPPEKTLGVVIRPVLLHGALVQVGLLTFAAAGLLGLVYLLRNSEAAYEWCAAAQKAALAIWIAYSASSMFATYLAWGQWIAWDEPRVRASAYVLWFAAACLLLVLWVNNRLFTALANMAVAVMAWYLIKGASLFRHPFDPIGSSASTAYRWYFIAILGALLLAAVQLTRWIRYKQRVV